MNVIKWHKFKYVSAMFCVLFVSTESYATGPAAITRIKLHANSNVYVYFSVKENKCGSTTVILRKSHVSFKEIYSTLLAAQIANNNVNYYTGVCVGDYAELTHLEIDLQ